MSELQLWLQRIFRSANPLHPAHDGALHRHGTPHVSVAAVRGEGGAGREKDVVRQSAAVPFRRTPDGIEVLLVTSRKKGKWTVPKGVIAKGMSPAESARKEAMEEAGVDGALLAATLGTLTRMRGKRLLEIQVFALEVQVEYPHWREMESRRRQWIPITDVGEYLGNHRLLDSLHALADLLSAQK